MTRAVPEKHIINFSWPNCHFFITGNGYIAFTKIPVCHCVVSVYLVYNPRTLVIICSK